MEHLEMICTKKKELPGTVDITNRDERLKLDQLGQQIAAEHSLRYEGYSVSTEFPHSLKEAVATLFFVEQQQ